ncbi:U3 small nucleolar RNA-interacting protein 2 [Anastrepha obliqua]|uniref:U3 small nucleolar RNA-interacting protein 2 n=1 Tax=Anastrepha obliqua TaxID=95512 RepID=UPI002409A875|nr:U3 small nucleolar RNA-interacting protein 2 [Anastrepha obliqua]
MSSSFFLKKEPKANKKRKLSKEPRSTGGKKGFSKKQPTNAAPPSRKRPQKEDEEIASDDDFGSGLDGEGDATNLVFSSDEVEEETPQDKRLRLAKQYLEEIEKQEAERAEDREIHDHVAQRLQSEYLDSVGKLRRNIAASIEDYDAENVVVLKHKKQHLPMCALVVSPDGKYVFSGAKTQFVLKWSIQGQVKLVGSFNVQAHTEDVESDTRRRSHVTAICLSSDMKYLALAEGGRNIQIWCPKELKHLKTFKGHRDVVTALVFRKDTHELYSGSKDRSVKIWSLDEMAYVESLFGHQAPITGIDALSRERAITSGGIDCSLRIWKITEESQLIYNGHQNGIECVKYINDENFVSGGEDGSLCLWSALKKKSLCKEALAHGNQSNGEANWITAVACVVNTDLLASGSCDGYIRLWQSLDNSRKLKQILAIPMPGFINALAFNSNGTKLFAAVGQEHRLGRWWRIKEAKNKIVIIDLITSTAKTS